MLAPCPGSPSAAVVLAISPPSATRSSAASDAAALLTNATDPLPLPPELQSIRARLEAVPVSLTNALETALVDDPPLLRRDGGFVREGFNSDLDAARTLRNDSRARHGGA